MKVIDGGHTMMHLDSMHQASVKSDGTPKGDCSAVEHLAYWAETQVDTSGGRRIDCLLITRANDTFYCKLTLGALPGN